MADTQRTLVESADYSRQLATLSDLQRLDDALVGVCWALSTNPMHRAPWSTIRQGASATALRACTAVAFFGMSDSCGSPKATASRSASSDAEGELVGAELRDDSRISAWPCSSSSGRTTSSSGSRSTTTIRAFIGLYIERISLTTTNEPWGSTRSARTRRSGSAHSSRNLFAFPGGRSTRRNASIRHSARPNELSVLQRKPKSLSHPRPTSCGQVLGEHHVLSLAALRLLA